MPSNKAYIVIFTLLLSLSGAAQGLPNLGKAPEITCGELPDGISYYLVANATAPGSADFAIVQPGRTDPAGARRDLGELPNFTGRKPYRFLADAGVAYGSGGFIRHRGGATEFRFRDVPVTDTAVSDSVLLLLFDLARTYQYRQAVVISGDINVPAIEERIRMLSMTVSHRSEAPQGPGYLWTPQEEAAVTTFSAPIGMISVSYRSPRTERELMNTLQPVMSKVLATEFNMVLERRVREAFRRARIPLADYGFRFSGSDDSASDERFRFSVQTSPERLDDAIRTIAGILSTLDKEGVTREEALFVHNTVSQGAARDRKSHSVTNGQYLDKCISAYLYGSNLESYYALSSVFTSRRLDIERERELLSRYISATVSSGRNLHLHAGSTVKPDGDRMLKLFAEGWEAGYRPVSDIPDQSDTLRFEVPRRKVKLSSSIADSYSGGKLLTFSNGISVIYKQTATKGQFQYGMMIRGGWNEISGISGSETAYVGQAAALEKVNGMSAAHFDDLLLMNGITLKRELLLSDLRYTGTAPSDKLSLVLKALLALANRQSPDREAFELSCESARVRALRDRFATAGTRAMLDSLLCPAYPYASGSMPDIPDEGFTERVDDYIRGKGASIRNGTIVLIGDIPESSVIKHLSQALGGFGLEKKRIVRPRIDYPLRECWATVHGHGAWRDMGVTVAMNSSWPFSAGGNTTLELACTAIEMQLARSMADLGYNAEVSYEASLLPSEKISLHIACRPVPAGGLPAGITPASPQVVLDAVRRVTEHMATEGVGPELLARSKARLTGRLDANALKDSRLRDNILYRNSWGRDLKGNYKDRIKALKSSDVKAVFEALSACKGEYIVQ